MTSRASSAVAAAASGVSFLRAPISLSVEKDVEAEAGVEASVEDAEDAAFASALARSFRVAVSATPWNI